MKIVKGGIIPRRIRMTCNCCGCVFIESRNKVCVYNKNSYIKLTTHCPQCGEDVWATVNKPEEEENK